MDFGVYQFGAVVIFFVGVLTGAIIVGICWSSANDKIKEAYNQHVLDAGAELTAAKAKLIKRSLRDMKRKAGVTRDTAA